jgi:phosphoribosylanthranilate isomerase
VERPVAVKVCGITNLADANLAAALGAWAVGLIFYPRSPRRCSFAEALAISTALRRRTLVCGVFVNAPLAQVVSYVEDLHLDLVQLHGDEGPAYCAEVARRAGVKVIKAVQVGSSGDLLQAERFHTDFHLLDSRPRTGAALRGGSGQPFEWSLLAARRSSVPLILSGGLTPANVQDAIAAAAPYNLYAVDTASGTELSPGKKDPAALEAFFAAVARANRSLAPAAAPSR